MLLAVLVLGGFAVATTGAMLRVSLAPRRPCSFAHRTRAVNHARLIVTFDDGTTLTFCIEFSEEAITGAELLRRSGSSVVTANSGASALRSAASMVKAATIRATASAIAKAGLASTGPTSETTAKPGSTRPSGPAAAPFERRRRRLGVGQRRSSAGASRAPFAPTRRRHRRRSTSTAPRPSATTRRSRRRCPRILSDCDPVRSADGSSIA